MKFTSVALYVGLLFGLATRAEAQQLISFDEMSPSENLILGDVTCGANGHGFRFQSNHFHLIGLPNNNQFQDYTSNETPHLGYEFGRGFPITLQRFGGGTFSLFSLDAAEFHASPGARPDAEVLTVTGYQADGGIVSFSLDLDGIRDGGGGLEDFEHFTLPPTFVNLTSVIFTGLRLDGSEGGVAIDNLEYQLSVPEPLEPCIATPLPPAPVVTITNPASGNVAGTVLVEATATDNLGVVGVQFKVDGVYLGVEDTTAPYSVAWDTTTELDGSHTLTAEARDAAGIIGIATMVVTVQNTPLPTLPHTVDFDGVNDYASMADAPSLSFGNSSTDTPLTMEMWLRPDALATRSQILGKWSWDNPTNQEYRLFIVSNTIQLDLRDQSTGAIVSAYTTGSLSGLLGGWHHLAVTYDGRGGATAAEGIAVYIDGVAVAVARTTNAAYVAMENLSAPLEIGRQSPAFRQYDGGLDELRLWNVARTATEIQGTRATELSGDEPGLVGYWRFNEGTGVAVADDSPGTHAATLSNGVAWVSGGPMSGPDTTPPDLSPLVSSALTATGVTLSFTTSEPATGWVAYTAGVTCPCTDVFSAGVGTTQVVTLSGLTPDTVYQVEAKATDAAGNLGVGPTMTIRTLVAPPDATPPTVVITQPATTAAGTVLVEATATDNLGVVGVQFKVDGVYLGVEDTTAPYSVAWDTTTELDGSHTLTAEARDAAGNIGVGTVVVTVQNTPLPTLPHTVDFDGVNDYASMADAPSLSFGNSSTDTPLTMEMWLRPDALATRSQILGKWSWDNPTNQEYRLFIVSNTIQLDLRDQSTGAIVSAYTTGSLSGLLGGWHHLAVTYDGRGGATAAEGIAVYIDGVAVAVARTTNAAYVAMENLSAPLEIGRQSPAFRQYDGGLDELRLWNVARTATEIQGTRATELSGDEPGLVGYWRFNEGTGVAVADDSPGTHAATLSNGVAWVSGGPMSGPDTTPPDLSPLVSSALTATGVTLSFTTSEPATGWVAYTAGVTCPCTDVFSAGVGTTQVVTLSGLTPDTVYQVEAKATDAAGNLGVGPTMTIRTLVAPPDATPPTVVITQPATTAAGTVLVEATATDNLGVVGVQFKVDGVYLGVEDTTAPYSVAWDTTTELDGSHTLTAEARDAAGIIGIATMVVTVQNTPLPTLPHTVDFDGVNDYASMADAPSLSFGNSSTDTPLTMEMWLRPDALATRSQILGKWSWDNPTNQEYRLFIVSNTIQLDLRDQSTGAIVSAYTTGSLSGLLGGWHHLAVTYDGRGGATAAEGIAVYIDGVAVAVARTTNAAYVAMENLSAPLEIGRQSPAFRQYDGGLDELRLWNVARTATEIQGTRATELSGDEPGLVGYWRFNEGTGVAVADDSPGTHAATLSNGVAWVSGGPMSGPDTTPPDLSPLVSSALTATGVTLSFTTSEPATGWVAYTAGVTCPCTDVFSAGVGTTQVVTLSGLTPDTVYQVEAKATDAAGNLGVGPTMTIRTLVAPPDATPPTVVITQPATTAAGTVLVEATATDNLGVVGVQFKVDGVYLGVEDTTAPYSVAWDTTTELDGSHTLTAEARDAAGNIGVGTVVVTVQNTPLPTLPHTVDFDGVNDYASMADAPSLSFGNSSTDTPLTMEMWLRPDALATRSQILGKWSWDNPTNQEYRLFIVSNTIQLDLRDQSTGAIVSAYTTGSLSGLLGGWHHLAVTYDGRGGATAAEGIAVYIDGVAVAVARTTNAAYVAMENLSAPLEIGRQSPAFRQYDGGLDELRLWNVARTATEIQGTRATELSGDEPGLVGYWRFNEGTGVAVADDSPGTHAATLSNGVAWVVGGPIP